MEDLTTPADDGVAPEGLPLDDDYVGRRDLPVQTVVSADGTEIAYEVWGSGPPVVVIGGGLNDRAMFTPFAAIMSEGFSVYNYDRRGRGDSGLGDPDTYVIEREVEDLAAVIAATGEPTNVFANCTGGMIAIHAAASGVPMAKLGMYEPPYLYPKITPENMAKLRVLVAEDRREEAVTLFGRDVVGFLNDETLEMFKHHPAWKAFESMVPSTIYDAVISEQHSSIPSELLPDVTVPTLILSGMDSATSIQQACITLSEEIPDASLIRLEGEGHLFNQKVGAPLMAEFFAS